MIELRRFLTGIFSAPARKTDGRAKCASGTYYWPRLC